jgi:ABC-2 type transport system permease protein
VSRRIHSELLKLRTTRTTLGLALGLIGLVAFLVVVQLIATGMDAEGAPRIDDPDNQRTLFSTASSASLFAVLLGVLSVTNEFRHGTIRPTLLFAPARELLIATKGIACGIAGATFGVLATVTGFAILLVWLSIDGTARLVGNGDLLGIAAGCIAAAVLWAAIGVGLGATVRNQVGAVIGTIVWTLIPEPLLQGLVPRIGKFTPGAASDALSGSSGIHLLSPLAGLGVLTGWAIVFLVAGAFLTGRRDVP